MTDPARPRTSQTPSVDLHHWLSLAIAVCATAACLLVYAHTRKFALHHPVPYLHYHIQVQQWRSDVWRISGFMLTLCWLPVALWAWRRRPNLPRWSAPLLLGTTCAGLAAFIETFGRWQFGAYDYQIVLETGWRQYLGQRPYIDFLSSAPPGFDLGLRFAFRAFHPGWDAVLLLTSVFAVTTFLWSYWLLVRLGCGRAAAWLTAFAVQSATTLLLAFWWYNNTAMVAAVLFLLSCGLFLLPRTDWQARASFVLSLALMLTMKPNFAGLAFVGGMALILLTSRHRMEGILAAIAGGLLALLTLLVCHVSPLAMVAAYRGASKERGVMSRFGLDAFQPREFWDAYISLWFLLIPLACLIIWALVHWKRDRRRSVATIVMAGTAVLIAIYGWRTNGEEADLEWTALLLVIGWFIVGNRRMPVVARHASAALLVGFTLSNLYQGAQRIRIYYVGDHLFYQADWNRNRIPDGLLKGMYVGSVLVQEQADAAAALRRWDGPYFFGPRIDFSYAEYGLQSPLHFPAWFHPGTAFDRALLPQVLNTWRNDHFHTLIFSRDDYTYYPPEFMQMIRYRYTQVEQTGTLSVWRAKPEWLTRPDFGSPDGSGLPVPRTH